MRTITCALSIVPIAAAIAIVCARADADGLNVSPVRVVLAPNQRTASITLTNNQDRPETLRVASFAWDQDDGGNDRLSATDELLVVPPIFSVGANAVKIVRFGLRTASSASRERTYRIFLTEVPPAAGPQSQITISYRFSVPVFLPATLHPSPKPTYSAQRIDTTHIRLHISNDGDAHIRVSSVKVYSDASRAKLLRDQAVAGYVLAGRSADFTLDVANVPPAATLVVSSATGEDLDDLATIVPVSQHL